MPVIGPRMAADLVAPTGTDFAKIFAFNMRNGRTPEEMIREAASIIGVVNERVMARYGGILYETQLDHVIYRLGKASSRRRTPKRVEGKMADPIRGDIIGHMLPVTDYEDAVGWSELYLRDAWDSMINADLSEVADSWENEVDFTVLTRMFSSAENAIGGGYDVPWAIGTGVNVPYIPPNWTSYEFTSSHTHFLYVNGAVSTTTTVTALDNAVKEIKHHGHLGTLVAMVSEADVASYTGITSKKWVTFVPPDVTATASSNSPALVAKRTIEGLPGEVIGWYSSDRGLVEVSYHPRIPTGYLWVGKSYGVNNERNPLALREHPAVGFGLVPEAMVTRSINPKLDYLRFLATYGVGVGRDRTNGVATFIDAASGSAYVDPTLV
jgi:hypothetical protein